MSFRLLAGAVLLAVAGVVARGETWETVNGRKVVGTLAGVYGPYVSISGKDASAFLPVNELKDDELRRVAKYLQAAPPPALWNNPTSKVGKALKGRLTELNANKLVSFDPGTRPEPDFYLVYFGAMWCPPCRAFSPRLVKAYNRLRPMAPGKFEVLFISSDRDDREQLNYVRSVVMPWPILKLSSVGRVPVLERWKGNGIPCLVAVTREGDVLFHSYEGEKYLGPDQVITKFEEFLRGLEMKDGNSKRLMHRLAVMQHVESAQGRDAPAAPYVVGLDLRRYQTLEVKRVMAKLEIDEKGTVTDATFEPELPAVLNHQLVSDAMNWLFLPAVKNGQASAQKAALPLVLREG